MTSIADARSRAQLTQDELAQLAGTTQPTIFRLETGKRKLTKVWAERLAPHLGVSPSELMFGDTTASDPSLPNYRPPPPILGERDLPVYSAVEGGPGAMVVSTDPIDMVQRPWFMREVTVGFAVVVIGESMVPVYEPGDLVIVNPKLPAIRGKNAIFVNGEEDGEFHATVKRLERSTVTDWHVRQWNPPEGAPAEFALPKVRWPKALRIVGKYEGG